MITLTLIAALLCAGLQIAVLVRQEKIVAGFAAVKASLDALETDVLAVTLKLINAQDQLAQSITPAQGDQLQAQIDTMRNNLQQVLP